MHPQGKLKRLSAGAFLCSKKWGVLPAMSISEADIGHDRRVAAVGTGGRGGALVADKLRAASRFPRFLLQQCQRSLLQSVDLHRTQQPACPAHFPS